MAEEIDRYIRISGEVGLPLNFVIKEFHAFDLLGQMAGIVINEKRKCVFKGGTALNKIYLKRWQRFSEDLDFNNYFGGSTGERISKLKELMKGVKGYGVSRPFRFRRTIRFECAYLTPRGQKDKVQVEFNLKNPKSKYASVLRTAESNVCGATVAGVRTYSLDDLVAQKLNAMLDRIEGKDIYDVYHAISLTKNLRGSIKTILKNEGKEISPSAFIANVIKRLESFDTKRIQKLTNPYILLENRPRNWEEILRALQTKLRKMA